MKKLYEKNELTFALLWIVVYCVLQSLANPLNKRIGIEYSASAAFCILQAVVLFAFIQKNHLQKRYGLYKSSVPACRFLYYVPLFILASGNLWNGIALNDSLPETVCRIVCISQYVILGAGMDTFAFREKEFVSEHRVYEVDHPLTQKDKQARIARAGWHIPENLTFVPVDFTKDRLSERLVASGFDKRQETLFSWLGVTYYLSAEAIDKTLSEIADLSAEGSALVFDCPDEGFFSASEKRVQNTIMMAKAGGEPMQSAFSYAELEKLLGRHGFQIYDWLAPCNIQTRIIENAGANLKAFEHVNYCLAVRKD